MIVKVMTAFRGNDAHPRHPHRLFEGVSKLEFYGPEPVYAEGEQPPRILGWTRPQVELFFSGDDKLVLQLVGNVYVMSDSGKTISSFEIDPDKKTPEEDAIDEQAKAA